MYLTINPKSIIIQKQLPFGCFSSFLFFMFHHFINLLFLNDLSKNLRNIKVWEICDVLSSAFSVLMFDHKQFPILRNILVMQLTYGHYFFIHIILYFKTDVKLGLWRNNFYNVHAIMVLNARHISFNTNVGNTSE